MQMIINGNAPVDLTGLNKRDIKDIERSMEKERVRLESEGFDEHPNTVLMNAIYHALVITKKLNKEKYTPKKYRKNNQFNNTLGREG